MSHLPTIFYSRDFSQRVINLFKGDKELVNIIDYLSTGNPKVGELLEKKANELLYSNQINQLKTINHLLQEYNFLTKANPNEKRR